MPDARGELTRLLQDTDLADHDRAAELMPLVYAELRSMASQHLARERAGHTLQATDLVHEAYLRLTGGQELSVRNRAHFFGILARSMRQVLIDHARRRQADKRGGDWQRTTLHSRILADEGTEIEMLDLHRALEKLSELDETLGQLVELRFFGALTVDEAAGVLGVSPRKAAKDWAAARLWLSRELTRY